MRHLVAEAVEAAELVEHAFAHKEGVGGRRQLAAIGQSRRRLSGAMVVEIARHRSRLAACARTRCRNRPASRPVASPPRSSPPAAWRRRSTTAGRARHRGARTSERSTSEVSSAAAVSAIRTKEGGAVGRRREGDEDDERAAFLPCEAIGAQPSMCQREHGEAGEDVGEQDARDPRQRGGRGEQDNDGEKREWACRRP